MYLFAQKENKVKLLKYAATFFTLSLPFGAIADVDSDFKERPVERFALYTGDGNYKQAYHWYFNAEGQGKPVTIFLNHGSGGEWYHEIDSRFGPCGPDYSTDNSNFEGLCKEDEEGNESYLADFRDYHLPVGPELEDFMLRKIVGSTQFAAWYWQHAFSLFDSPVHIFMVGRYNVVTDPVHLDNALYWLNTTDREAVTRETVAPYNFDGYGVASIAVDKRPMHAAPDISGFDNMFLYKAVAEQFPEVSLQNVIVEGRSDGGSAMIAMASDYHIWPQHMRDFWSRNLPESEVINPVDEVIAGLSLDAVAENPTLAEALNTILAQYSEQDILDAVNSGQTIALSLNGQNLIGSAGKQMLAVEPELNTDGDFDTESFPDRLAEFLHGDFYHDVKMAHAFYPGCRIGGLMEQNHNLAPGEIAEDGDSANGYKVAIPLLFSFGNDDSLYNSYCDNRVNEAELATDVAGAFVSSDISDGTQAVIGEVFSPARHGFDYKDVYKNLSNNNLSQARANESRRAIERAVNQAIRQLDLEGNYTLPVNID